MDLPIKHSYCVLPGKIYAGEYAGDKVAPHAKVRQFIAFGITHFVDLTEEGELSPYAHYLPKECSYRRFPIKDVSVPGSCSEVFDLMEYIVSVISKPGNKVYIHCWGGVGRTGTIVACLYEYLGENYEYAVRHLRESFRQCPKSQWRQTPETDEQLKFVKEFDQYLGLLKEKNMPVAKQPQYTPEHIEHLKDNEVFVFGSSFAGHHGGGAARVAREKFGAIPGCAVGLHGRSYAIPTMQGSVEAIRPYVDEFIDFARDHSSLVFYVTRIGCGSAGFKDEDIAPLFAKAVGVGNIILPKTFADILAPKLPFDASSVEGILNWTLPGLQFFYRDTDIDADLDKLAEEYRERNIIRAGFFIDCTSRAAKPVKHIRFIIASAHAAPVWQVMGDAEAEQWRLNVLDYNSYFKVVDTYRVGNHLQILLLHIPLKGIAMFSDMGNLNFGDGFDLVKIARKSFDDKSNMEPLPWLETRAWNERTKMLPGTSSEGWASLDPVAPLNDAVANLHNAVLGLSQDDTDLNQPG